MNLQDMWLQLAELQANDKYDEYVTLATQFDAALALAQQHMPEVREPKVYPSYSYKGGHAGIFAQGHPVGDDAQVCVRKAYLRCHGVEEIVDELSSFVFAVGLAHERVYKEKLEPQGWKFSVRLQECPTVEGIPLRGEVDMESPEGVPYELKSISSSDYLKPYLVLGEPKTSNIIQLCYYMAVFDKDCGILRYTSGIRHKQTIAKVEHKFVPGQKRDYTIRVDSSGCLSCDGKPLPFNMQMLFAHIEFSAFVFGNDVKVTEVPRPMNFDPAERKPDEIPHACRWCKLRDACSGAEQFGLMMSQLPEYAANFPGIGKGLR